VNPFLEKLSAEGLQLHRAAPRSVQINLGKMCNLTCNHCHVNAGPTRQEAMSRETMDRVIDWIAKSGINTVDLTGGAPEMVPDFRYLVEQLRALQPPLRIIDRSNLTILLEKKYSWLAEFLAAKKVEIIASLPSLSSQPVTLQRGEGVFDASIAALRMLNRLGYGVAGELQLHLVVNPIGLQLPQDRQKLEKEFRTKLATNFGIIFNRLFSSANVPVGRFATVLRLNNRFESYMQSLVSAFDPQTLSEVACRDSINVGWQGEVYDCDFNQQLAMQWRNGHPTFLWDVDPQTIADREIMTGEHCFGCVVRSGGGCGSPR
jgi:radical SAM/Cys-rich protein